MARRDRIVVNKDNASTGGVVGWTQRISVFYKLFQIYKLFNKRGGWNKRGGGAKNAKSLNVEAGINVI